MTEQMSYTTQVKHNQATVDNVIQHTLQSMQRNNKRKRGAADQDTTEHPGSKRASSSSNVNGNGNGNDHTNMFQDSSIQPTDLSFSQSLSRHLANSSNNNADGSNASATAAAALGGMTMPHLTVPQPTDMSFASNNSGTDGERQQLDASFDLSQDTGQGHHTQGTPYNLSTFTGTAEAVHAARESANGGATKPPVGSDEWHKLRKDNHKEGNLPYPPPRLHKPPLKTSH